MAGLLSPNYGSETGSLASAPVQREEVANVLMNPKYLPLLRLNQSNSKPVCNACTLCSASSSFEAVETCVSCNIL